MPSSCPQPKSNSGYALLGFVIFIIFLLIIILIPLYNLALVNIRSASTSRVARQTFYSTEAVVYDTVASILSSNYTWPDPTPIPPYPTPFVQIKTFNDVTTTIETVRGNDMTFTITATSAFQDTSRKLRAKLSSQSSGGTPSDVVIVMDTSGSMKFAGSSPEQPMQTAIDAAIVLVNKLEDSTENTRIGVVEFNNRASSPPLVGLTDEDPVTGFQDVRNILNGLSANGGTNIADGIRVAREELAVNGRSISNQYIVLLSDGAATHRGSSPIESCGVRKVHSPCTCGTISGGIDCKTVPDPESAVGQAITAKDLKQIVFTVGLNLQYYSTSAPQSCIDNLDTQLVCGEQAVARDTLKRVANGGDHFYDAADKNFLDEIYNDIADEIIESALFELTEIKE